VLPAWSLHCSILNFYHVEKCLDEDRMYMNPTRKCLCKAPSSRSLFHTSVLMKFLTFGEPSRLSSRWKLDLKPPKSRRHDRSSQYVIPRPMFKYLQFSLSFPLPLLAPYNRSKLCAFFTFSLFSVQSLFSRASPYHVPLGYKTTDIIFFLVDLFAHFQPLNSPSQ